MDEKLFCSKCGYRIWRYSDSRPRVDNYFQDRHFNCGAALGAKPPQKDGKPDLSYRERKESVSQEIPK